MAGQKKERRKGVRLTSRKSGAGAFKCGKCDALPPQALVADVSEDGVHLLFDWPAETDFPLQVGDGMGFHLKVEGAEQGFELWSIVRRVDPRDERGQVGVGVEFTGLDPVARAALQKTLVSMAMTRLRTWRADGQPVSVGVDPSPAPEAGSRRKRFSERLSPGAAGAAPKAPAAASGPRRKLFLGEILVRQGALDADRFGRFLSAEFKGNRPLGQELLERGLTTDAAIARALAEQARLPYADPAATAPDVALASRLPRHVFVKHRCVPLGEEGGAVVLAMSAPPDLKELEALREGLGRRVRVRIAPESELAKWRKRVFNEDASPSGALRFHAQLRVEYRLMDAARRMLEGCEAGFGLTQEISASGLLLASRLPSGVTPERIVGDGLLLDLLVDCPSLSAPLNLFCVPQKIEAGKTGGEHLISCRIDGFAPGGEMDWARVCMVHGTHRFRPQKTAR